MAYWLTRFASWLAGKVPRRVRLAVAGLITTLVYYLWTSKRRVTIANMAQVLGVSTRDPRAHRLARQSWRNYGRYLSDFFYLPNATREQVLARVHDVTPEPGSLPMLAQAMEQGSGLIIATAHFGAWDIAGVVVATERPLYVVVDTFTDARMDDLIQSQRTQFGLRVLRAEKSPRPILRTLKDNQAVAIVCDRPMTAGEGIAVTFFGRRCYVPSGVAQLALLAGAPICVGGAYYDEQFSSTYYLLLEETILPERTGDRERDVAELTQRVYSALERVIAQHPDQWYMFRPFWPEEQAANTADGSPAEAAPGAPGGAYA
jgi:KDO2-lipid IV(A) lauroyltransferase